MRNSFEIAPRSKSHDDLVQRSKDLLPGGTTNSLVQPEGLEFIAERGEGAFIYDVDGRRHLDFMMGAGPLILGHAHPRIVETVKAVAELGTHHFGLNRRTVELAERIAKYVPSAEMVRFTSSGSEATFHAVRLARAATGRSLVLKCIGGYHGHHDLAVWSFEGSDEQPRYAAVAESAGVQAGTQDDVLAAPYNDSRALKDVFEQYGDRVAAFILEPMQRMIPPVAGFLETAREQCDKSGAVLIFDEVVTGFRLAPGGGQEKYGVTPDLTTLGKAVAGGVPLGVLCGRRRIMEHLSPAHARSSRSFQCGTFNGNLLGAECAHVTLDLLIEEDGLSKLDELGAYARDRLAQTLTDAGQTVSVQGEGPMFHPFFTDRTVVTDADAAAADWDKSNAFHRKLAEAGIYKPFRKGYLSLAHEREDIDELCAVGTWALAQLNQDTG